MTKISDYELKIFKLRTDHIFNCKRWQAIVQKRKVADFLSCIFRKVVLLSHWLHILPYHTLTQNPLLLVSKGLSYGWKKTEMTPEFPVLQGNTCWQSLGTPKALLISVSLWARTQSDCAHQGAWLQPSMALNNHKLLQCWKSVILF